VPLYFVTGISGSGKSTVRNHLRRQGYLAYATDEDGYASWFDNETGDEYLQQTTSAERTPEFGRRYSWKVPRDKVLQLAADAAERPIFLCGAVANEVEVWDLFAGVVALDIDTDTLKQRLASRTDNDFGKSDHEREQVLAWHADSRAAYHRAGHLVVDATKPIDDVVDQVLALTVGRPSGSD
jgi:thymidylate kinase